MARSGLKVRADRLGRCAIVAALLFGASITATRAATVASVVDGFAEAAIQNGSTEGLEIVLVIGTSKPTFFHYGVADVATRASPNQNTLFQIGSVTKVFTTNLLGQAVNSGARALGDPLSDFATQLGTLPADTGQVTLQDLGDFTGGFPTLAALCAVGQKPSETGCLPGTRRPSVAQYTGADFAAFFRTYQTAGAPPAHYLYSDFSVGLLGLLLGAPPGSPLDKRALAGWQSSVKTQVLRPLQLHSTFLDVPAQAAPRLAPGYTQALAGAEVANGTVSDLELFEAGAGYSTPPAIVISGGGGTGALADAQVGGGKVTGLTVSSHGTGCIAPPSVKFGGGSAKGNAIVRNGHVVGVSITAAGSYTTAPTVTFSGGRIGGREAEGTVLVDHELVTYVKITDGGAGYVDPVAVAIAPGAPANNVVPIWAPAGALTSSARDLATFATAALGHTRIGGIDVPAGITAGFAISETPYACEKGPPALDTCHAMKSGLAWDIATTAPATLTKDGGLAGYSSVVLLMPSQDTAVVVLANSRQSAKAAVAPHLGQDILFALYHQGLLAPSH